MTVLTLSQIAANLDTLVPNSGNYASILLLLQTLRLGIAVTVDASTDVFTSVGHGLKEATVTRFNTTAILPSPLVSGIDYFVSRIDDDNFKVASSYANLIATTYVNLTDTGSGTQTFNEQPFTETRYQLGQIPKDLLVANEISHPNYDRQYYADPGAALVDAINFYAYKPNVTASYSVPLSSGNLDYQYILLLAGGNLTIGDTTGTPDLFKDIGSVQSIIANTLDIPISYRSSNG